MAFLPATLTPLFSDFAAAFSAPTFQRFLNLLWAAILTTGRRTVANALRLLPPGGDPSSFRRVLSHRVWSSRPLALALARFLLTHHVPHGPVRLVIDDTLTEHRGPRVYGKGRHRDPLRSSHSYTTFLWGQRWIVLALRVSFPFARRPWALPVLVALYHTPADNKARGHRHRTPAQLAALLVRLLMRRFPGRRFIVSGDGEYSTHALAALAGANPRRLTWIGKLPPNANLYLPPPQAYGLRKPGRPAKKGAKLPSPEAVVARSPHRRRLQVAWYGGQSRTVESVIGMGFWYKGGQGLVPLQWVFVHDCEGTHRDDYFFSTDVSMPAAEIIEAYTGRWSMEVTFEELKTHLGLGTPRGWTAQTVKRAEPCLFGLFSLVVLLDVHRPCSQRSGGVVWEGKRERTFSDVLTSVRRWLWTHWGFGTPSHTNAFAKLPAELQSILLYALAPAA